MTFRISPTELTTAATDAVLGVQCVVLAARLWRSSPGERKRAMLWCRALGLLAFASFLGAVAHGFEMPEPLRNALWKPLYLSLGILVALFLVGAIYDWRGPAAASRLLPWGIGTGSAFYALTEILQGSFLVFVVYEAVVMLCVLCIYLFLACTHRREGAWLISGAILLNLLAAGVQASSLSFHLVFPFDHNGAFHFIQMAGIATLAAGLRKGMRNTT